MDTFQVFVGRQHQLGLEVEGITYELMLGSESDLAQRAKALPSAASSKDASGLVAQNWMQQRSIGEGVLALPETAVSGPLELVLPAAEPINVYAPLAADVGVGRSVLISAGTTVYVSGVKRATLRRSVELPRLPGQYLAEVYAHARLGEPEEGFHNAPGILYMANELRERALNASNIDSSGVQKGQMLLSFEVEPVGFGTLTIRSAPEDAAEGMAPRLKVKKSKEGVVELSLRQGQVAAAGGSSPFSLAALTRIYAWPLPHAGMSAWVPYETVLRGVLASHPFVVDKVVKHGIGLKLTKSSIQGVSLIAFDMEVRAKEARPPELEGTGLEHNESPLEVWEAVVQVVTDPKAAGVRSFVPLHVKRKASYQNTMTVSRQSLQMALAGGSNDTAVPLIGFEEEDLGLARSGGEGEQL